MGEYDVRKHIVAVGHVQGCGFRYYTTMAAKQYHLTRVFDTPYKKIIT